MKNSPFSRPLGEGNEFLELAEASAGIGVWDMDLASRMVRGRPQFFRLMGLDPAMEEASIEVMRALRHPDDRAAVVDGFNKTLESQADYFESEYRIIWPDGQIRWILGRGRIIRDASGQPVRYSGVDIDVTERKDADARQALLVRELQHRGKNLLAVMQSIASSTLRSCKDLATAHDTLLGRLRALARAQEFIAMGSKGGALIDDIVRAELEAFGGRVTISGPRLTAGNTFAQMFSVVVHELATNATKYGALSVLEGRIEIRWAVDNETGFSFVWIERGGPPVRTPVGSGFGSQLIKAALGGAPRIHYGELGFEYEIHVPLEEIAGN